MMRKIAWMGCALLVAALAGCQRPVVHDDAPDEPERTAPDTPPTPEAAMVSDAAVGQLVTASVPPNPQYPANGIESLIDGRMGSESHYDQEWMGWWYEDKPFQATIDLGKLVAVKELGVHTLTSTESWIFYPRSVDFELSKDGKTYKKVASVAPTDAEMEDEYPATTTLVASNLEEEARYVRVSAQRYGALPDWHLGHGGADGYEGEAWLFIDEILVNPR